LRFGERGSKTCSVAIDQGGTTVQTAANLKALIAAERAGQPFIQVRSSDGTQQIFDLSPGTWRATIGRHDGCDISIPWDPKVSRVHAIVELVGSQWTFIDDGLSRNGSYTDGSRLVGRHTLKDGDRLCVGDTVLIFHDPGEHDSDSTARESSEPQALPLSPAQRKILIALCRPVSDSASATPATNRQIAEEVFLSVDAVKAHLRVLFERFGLDALPQNEKRARLAATVLAGGVLAPRDF
jgi:pSer/pThr/pTyr-binding forkhead associated (FHA) protein